MSQAGDRAFNPKIKCADFNERDLGGELGAPSTRQTGRRLIRNAFILCLLLQFWLDTDRFVYYSRDNNHYAKTRRYHSRCYSARNVIWAVESLDETGILEHHRTRPSPQAWYSSTARFRHDVSQRLGLTSVWEFDYDIPELIILKDGEGRLMSYHTSPEIRALRQDVRAQNAILTVTDIRLDHPHWHVDEHGLLRTRDRVVNPARKGLYRVFNQGDWQQGGRFYGPFWQQLSSSVRRSLLINGAPVIELDYNACHPRLMYALVGQTLTTRDPYDIEGFDRSVAKVAFQKLINTPDLKSAARAIAEPFSRRGIKGSHHIARRIIVAFQKKHPSLNPLFGTGIGLRLQRIDSDICAELQQNLRDQDIPALTVHDSFIVPQYAQPTLEEAMAKVFERTCRRITP